MLDSKHTCPFLQRETLSLSFKTVHYTNILEKVVWNKEQPVPHLQDMQKQERSVENSFPTVQSNGLFCRVETALPTGVRSNFFHMLPSGAYGCDHNTKKGMSSGGIEEEQS